MFYVCLGKVLRQTLCCISFLILDKQLSAFESWTLKMSVTMLKTYLNSVLSPVTKVSCRLAAGPIYRFLSFRIAFHPTSELFLDINLYLMEVLFFALGAMIMSGVQWGKKPLSVPLGLWAQCSFFYCCYLVSSVQEDSVSCSSKLHRHHTISFFPYFQRHKSSLTSFLCFFSRKFAFFIFF